MVLPQLNMNGKFYLDQNNNIMNIIIKGHILDKVTMVSVNYDTSLTVVKFINEPARYAAFQILSDNLGIDPEPFGDKILQFKESFSVIE